MGRAIFIAGVVLVVAGLLLQYAPGLMKWFGHLPGDIRYESGDTRVYIPIASMLVVSIVLSILLHLFRR